MTKILTFGVFGLRAGTFITVFLNKKFIANLF